MLAAGGYGGESVTINTNQANCGLEEVNKIQKWDEEVWLAHCDLVPCGGESGRA